MVEERLGLVTLMGNPMTLLGSSPTVGDRAPEFQVLDETLTPVTLADSAGKVRLFSVIPSLDTPVCDEQVRLVAAASADLPEAIVALAVSVDLPFAQKRWCAAAQAQSVRFLSDHRDLSFGIAYGVAMKEPRLLARAMIVVDRNDSIAHFELVGEISQLPDVDRALEAARTAAG